MSRQRHVVHLVYRFAAGGLENVIVQLVNGLPHDEFRHTIVALTEVDPSFISRIQRKDVEIVALGKKPGQPFALYPRVYRLLRRLRPDVMHTCNLAALEFMPVAWLARVPLRVHAEHGWDVRDPDGSNQRYRKLRRLYRPFVNRFVAVSAQIHEYLRRFVGVPQARLHLILNGVDTERFRPRQDGDMLPQDFPFEPEEDFILGTVGRLERIKNQRLLIDAFMRLAKEEGGSSFRLVIVGDGALREELTAQVRASGLEAKVWLAGNRSDIPELLRTLDCFVLPSLAEGTSCTLQEAMASGLPIVATDVGGNAELLAGGALGRLTPSNDATLMLDAIRDVIAQGVSNRMSARQAVIDNYSLDAMLRRYSALFGGA